MERHTLRVVIVLGVLVTLLGGTGIFAVFTDRATGGQNSVTSGERPSAADLKIATGQLDATGISCSHNGGPFTDDTTTPQVVVTDIQPGTTATEAWICLQNAGSASLSVSVSAIDIVNSETGCTGDEAVTGDESCGGGPGELSAALTVSVLSNAACNGMWATTDTHALGLLASTPIDFGPADTLAPGEIECVGLRVEYPSVTPEAVIQVAQSDRVTWRFAFDGTAP